MDVTIHTSDPEAIPPAEVAQVLTEHGWFVHSVAVVDRTPEGGTAVWDFDVEGAAKAAAETVAEA